MEWPMEYMYSKEHEVGHEVVESATELVAAERNNSTPMTYKVFRAVY